MRELTQLSVVSLGTLFSISVGISPSVLLVLHYFTNLFLAMSDFLPNIAFSLLFPQLLSSVLISVP